MKIRYIVSMSGASETFPAFEKDNKGEWVFYDVDKLEAVNLINAEYAVPKVEKEFKDALAEVEELKAKKEADKKLAEDILNLDTLKARKEELENELLDVESSIERVEVAMGTKEKTLVELYNENRNIVDNLSVKELKLLCKDLDVKFTKEDEIREHLKTMEALEDK